ncbi:hypothetical protein BsWGS_18730 [Bradybaena similaris]
MASGVYTIKVLLIGDQGVGKTSLARTLTEGVFPIVDVLSATGELCHQHTSNKDTTVRVGDNIYTIQIIDPHNEKVMTEHLSQVDICHLCFDISTPTSFDSISRKWQSYIKQKSKVILVGLKSDLAYDKATCQQLDSQGLRSISQEAGHCLANKIKASQYIEVSALKYLGIEQLKDKTVFEFINQNAAHHIIGKTRCLIM